MFKTILFDLTVAGVFLVMITILVFAHELGHYLFARLFKMGVEEFAIGFGPRPLWIYGRRSYDIKLTEEEATQWEAGQLRPKTVDIGAAMTSSVAEAGAYAASALESGEVDDPVLERRPDGPVLRETTRFTIRLLPLGGFVRIKGMLPEEDGGETRIPGGFYKHPPIQRLAVLFAGPLFSVLAGLVILIPYFMIEGKPVRLHDPVFGIVAPTGPAAKAGLEKGDRIVAIDGVPTHDFYDIIVKVRESDGKALLFTYERNGVTKTTTVVPASGGEPTPVWGADLEPTHELKVQGRMGVAPNVFMARVSLRDAIATSAMVPVITIGGLIQDVLHPKHLSDDVGGPVAMVQGTAEATREGIMGVLWLTAMLSISLGIFNLLPVPPLDGGQMVMSFAELLRRGRRLSIQAQGLAVTMGLSVVGLLVVCVLYIDIHRIVAPANSPMPPSAVQTKK
jgi:regulator of sigma E protease